MTNSLYANFQHVQRQYSVQPFWFWNGPLTPEEVQRQIEALAAQGVHGAHIHNRSGLRPRYLSEDWWALVRAAVDKSAEIGFELYACDEYNWPSGEARDYTNPTYPSRVISTNREYRMRSLKPDTRTVRGGKRIALGALGEHDHVVVGVREAAGELDADSLREITDEVRANGGDWQAPDGLWELFTFRLYESVGVDGGQVDLMNPDAIRTFLDIVYEQYKTRVGDQFGKGFRGFYVDHEGDYGWRLAWTPRLFDAFRAAKGYDLVPMLPLLLEDGGARTPVVRCDYFETVGTLYTQAFWQQIADWATANGVRATGHVWEENLQSQVAFQGDHFQIQRANHTPGIDTLFEWGRFPRHFKEASSVADFRGLPLTVENQGVQGADRYLSLEQIKRTTNMLGVWGTTVVIPHAMNGNPDRIDFPEDWFERQPWWKYFHYYADYAARISYMNSDSQHVAEILLYYPIESAWAHGDVCFSETKWHMGFDGIDTERGQIIGWNNVVDEINEMYGDIIDTLPAHLWDLNIADHHYLREATIEDGKLHIGNMAFRVLILPPMTTIRRATAQRIREFAEAGGIVLAVRRLPVDSMESGRGDAALRQIWEAIFGSELVREAQADSLHFGYREAPTNARALWIADVNELLVALDRLVEPDVRVVRGDGDHLFALHRIKDARHVYWFVNDSGTPKQVVVDVPLRGEPMRWNPEDGSHQPIIYSSLGHRTELHLEFEAWGAFYVVFEPGGTAQPIRVVGTNLTNAALSRNGTVSIKGRIAANGTNAFVRAERDGQYFEDSTEIPNLPPIRLEGAWQVTPVRPTAPIWYARTRAVADGEGLALGWHLPGYNDAFWQEEWLSPERFSIRNWWILGIFDYHDHLGFNEVMPPEREIDLEAEYTGRRGQKIRWKPYHSPERVVDLDHALGTGEEKKISVRFVTAFALTHIYSPHDQAVELRVVADCNAKAWLNDELLISERDDHQGYLELRDAFGMSSPARLKQGWNRLLLKVSQGTRFAGVFGFSARLCDTNGDAIHDLIHAPSPSDDALSKTSTIGECWYRFPVPPGATHVKVPQIASIALFADGVPLAAQPGQDAPLPGGASMLAIRLGGDAELPNCLVFRTGTVETLLQSWTHTGLTYYSGEFVYEKTFELPASYLGCRLLLGLGTVGNTAEVWVNGQKIGERVWQPFRFDVTQAVREGTNQLRILVANTAANERAGGHTEYQLWGVPVRGPELLDNIEENGLLGPVTVTPFMDVEIPLG
jgi:hypothetical protein